ncbi:arsenic resistance N-acetyltransferase ArsN2 [Halorussus gelatinilyticus]|uniref:Arsenic resistance N-acetyltransferase ArsN2 n=1 Tax=Halorussus gelatinilyticus TaxID=2937524 RepID=A0A8U0IGS4_9EURY|nr:arsenic resistance N-acetyltransferase ArsN2 [Halorussus gelatinilyticus]UPV99880.1 arsenic resistance N-acetyltransferase ArsN2 [Halorussus gelatinilyticus]
MNDSTVTLRPADEDALSYVETLLERNDLPASDVRSNPDCFYVAYDGDEAVGVGGVERYGSDGLLRSVVVERSARGDGLGTALCDALERDARDSGVETLYLLATTAAEFFADRGYDEIERAAAPETIRQTTEFTDLCPDSATCMKRSLSSR